MLTCLVTNCPTETDMKKEVVVITKFYRKILSSKNSKEIWNVIHHIVINPNMNTLLADQSERLVEENVTDNDVILSNIDLLTNKS